MKFCPQCGKELKEVEIEGKSRPACKSKTCDFVFWDNPTPVVAALVERDGAVVLVRNKEWPEKIYGLVTGFLEKGETPDSGILREVKEELGLEGKIVDFIGYYSFYEMNQLILAFHVQVQGDIVLGEELVEMKIIPSEKLRPWPFGTGYAVRDWLEKRRTP
ncbi:MAG: NUDIX domain-containing protein [bacterium]